MKRDRHDYGELVEPPCPRCGEPAIYNGNYFCANFDECGWALPDEPERTGPDRAWFRQAYQSLIRRRMEKDNG